MIKSDLTADLKKIEQPTMADIVELRLRDYLRKKLFKVGDSLPSEQQLAESLGVSRNVVREALSRLRMLGIVETRKKRGMQLSRPDVLGSMERVLDPVIMDSNTLQDLFELRLTLEVGLADLLYKRKTKADVLELEQIAIRQQATVGKPAFRIKHEIAFHGKLYEMTGNETMQRFQTMLLPIFGYVMQLEKVYTPAAVSHMDLVEILKNGNKEKFRQGMLLHLKNSYDKLPGADKG